MSKHEIWNLKVLVVEDEMMVAMLIEDMLDDFGCIIVGPGTNVPRALDLINKEQVKIAILDLNLDGRDTCAIADALQRQKVPLILRPVMAPLAFAKNMQIGRFCRSRLKRAIWKARSQTS